MTSAKTIGSLVAFVCTLLAAPALADAPCATFSVARDDIRVNYNPFSASQDRTNFVLRAERRGSEVAQVRALIKDATPRGDLPVIGTDGPAEYTIVSRSNDAQDVFGWRSEQLNGSNGLTLTFRDSRNIATTNLTLVIPALQPSAAVRHNQPLDVLYECFNANGVSIGSGIQTNQDFAIDLTVLRVFGAYTGSLGTRSGTVDFGPIDVNATGVSSGRAVITAVSSVRYGLTIDSERGFQIRQTATGPGLPYTATLDGLPVGQNARFVCSRSGPSGRDHQIVLGLDTRGAANLPAGAYSDTLTVTFLARDGAEFGNSRDCVAGD
jgi:hypothetical protein